MPLYKSFLKRVIDIIASLVALLVLSPLFLILIVWLLVSNDGAGVFFKQDRPGMKNKIFKVIKFKTMNDKRDHTGKLLPDEQRLTKLGRFVRSASLDEIPQLFNVLWGDMSLVGPRPLLKQYLPLYNSHQARRHEVRPGITGWAQVNGRNALSWEEKFNMDVWYVDNLSFILDVKILFRTLIKVFKSEGINQPGMATMKPFNGNAYKQI